MNWFTIAIRDPGPELDLSRTRQNQAGDWIVFDGRSTRAETIQAARRLVGHCGEISVFQGRQIGRLIMEWTGGGNG